MFVTNSLSFLPSCDEVIVLENGRIEQFACYNKICKNKIKSLESKEIKRNSSGKFNIYFHNSIRKFNFNNVFKQEIKLAK